MKLLDLMIFCSQMMSQHGNINVMIDSFPINQIEMVDAIPGEHGKYLDLCSVEGEHDN